MFAAYLIQHLTPNALHPLVTLELGEEMFSLIFFLFSRRKSNQIHTTTSKLPYSGEKGRFWFRRNAKKMKHKAKLRHTSLKTEWLPALHVTIQVFAY